MLAPTVGNGLPAESASLRWSVPCELEDYPLSTILPLIFVIASHFLPVMSSRPAEPLIIDNALSELCNLTLPRSKCIKD